MWPMCGWTPRRVREDRVNVGVWWKGGQEGCLREGGMRQDPEEDDKQGEAREQVEAHLMLHDAAAQSKALKS